MAMESLTQQDVLNLHAYHLLKAAEARKNIVAFFEYVMRDFTKQKPIKLAPHQHVGLEFILAHDNCVLIWPAGFSKTLCVAGLILFDMGHDHTTRGAIVSASQTQAEKIISIVRDYIERSAELRLVFPDLCRSRVTTAQWTQTAITIDRPSGIKDPTLAAYGIDSAAVIGSRLNRVYIDDILNAENTNTKEQRDKVTNWVESSIRSRLDPKGSRMMIT